MIKEDLSKYDLSARSSTRPSPGEALNPEVFQQFEKATGLQADGGLRPDGDHAYHRQPGRHDARSSAPWASRVPLYEVDLRRPATASRAEVGETGEIVHPHGKTARPAACSSAITATRRKRRRPGTTACYHTGDTAWRDEDGYFWYVGRIDDVIKSSGYRIGPFEIESVIMELPYVLECARYRRARPDPRAGRQGDASC